MLAAEFLGADAVVVPITCNDGVDRGPSKNELEPRTQVGSPYVIAGMEQAKKKGKKRVCGWEANGGFLTGSDIEKDGRTLSALPTRDAVSPILAVLFCMVEQQVPLAELFGRLPKRYSRAALLKQFPRRVSRKILAMRRSLFSSPFFLLSLLILCCFSCAAVRRLPSSQYPYGGLRPDGEEGYQLFKNSHAAISIMPLGDSITEGTSSGTRERQFMAAYRKALWDKLRAARYEIHFVGSQPAGEAIPDFEPHHEGHSGWTADQIAASIFDWLHNNPADIVLLHIGTNDISRMDEDPGKVERIFEEIDRYSTDVWIVLARIVNRRNYVCSENSWGGIFDDTTRFNNEVEAMALARIKKGDKIILVDMECGADFNYQQYPYGDMWDELHPYKTGYTKMAETWFLALERILPIPPTRGTDQP